jgi:hypothetical protein
MEKDENEVFGVSALLDSCHDVEKKTSQHEKGSYSLETV